MKTTLKTKEVSKVKVKEKPAHYQVIFTTIEEATKDAKEQSKKQGIRLYIIQSRKLFFVDSESRIREKETILTTYESGKKVTVK